MDIKAILIKCGVTRINNKDTLECLDDEINDFVNDIKPSDNIELYNCVHIDNGVSAYIDNSDYIYNLIKKGENIVDSGDNPLVKNFLINVLKNAKYGDNEGITAIVQFDWLTQTAVKMNDSLELDEHNNIIRQWPDDNDRIIILDGIIGTILTKNQCSINFIKHRGIVFSNGIPFVLMDIGHGLILKYYLRKKDISPLKIKSIALQILNSLDIAYDMCGFVHGDLSNNLKNIIIDDTTVKDVITYRNGASVKTHGVFVTIIDFGSSSINAFGEKYEFDFKSGKNKTECEDLISLIADLFKFAMETYSTNYKQLLQQFIKFISEK